MKRLVPLLISAFGGFALIIAFFMPGQVVSFLPSMEEWGEIVSVWFDVLASIAFILGGGNLLKVHLKKISDRAAGWGYSGVTLLAFVVTLWIGLAKVGTNPSSHSERFGESQVSFSVEWMPTFEVAGTIPPRGDGAPLPASVRERLEEVNGKLVFHGWMSEGQLSELNEYQDTLKWRCTVATLFNTAQPPSELAGRVDFDGDHGVLRFTGLMTPEDKESLRKLFSKHPESRTSVDQLASLARIKQSVSGVQPPSGFAIPPSEMESEQNVTLESGTLTIQGPMTEALRGKIALDWTNAERLRPWTAARREALLQELATHGAPLTEDQRAVFHQMCDGIWGPQMLVLAINSAGGVKQRAFTPCELLEQQVTGKTDLQAKESVGTESLLNEAQEAALTTFLTSAPDVPVKELATRLSTELKELGPLLPAQEQAVSSFLKSQIPVAQFERDVCVALMQKGAQTGQRLSPAQVDFLMSGIRELAAWEQQVNELFRKSHVTKYRWSGDYADQGSPFWWLYEFVFQPLTATMFAMLAFYVASAAFRAFRAKNIEASLLLGTAFIILLGRTFAGVWLTAWIPDTLSALRLDEATVHIMKLFNVAGSRAIMIGIALGIASTSLKVLLGVDRSYLGSDD